MHVNELIRLLPKNTKISHKWPKINNNETVIRLKSNHFTAIHQISEDSAIIFDPLGRTNQDRLTKVYLKKFGNYFICAPTKISFFSYTLKSKLLMIRMHK